MTKILMAIAMPVNQCCPIARAIILPLTGIAQIRINQAMVAVMPALAKRLMTTYTMDCRTVRIEPHAIIAAIVGTILCPKPATIRMIQ